MIMTVSSRGMNIRHSLQLFLLAVIVGGLSFLAVILPFTAAFTGGDLHVGDVATQDILAPSAISYTSEVLTTRQRDTAFENVVPIYTSADTSIARQQLEHLRDALAYITSIRADEYANSDQKITDLAALQGVSINQETALVILELSDIRWQTIQQEAIVVLEQVMRSTIRDTRLDDYRRGVPNLVSLSLPEDQAEIVAVLASALVAPNSFYSESLTETAREEAAAAVEPVVRVYAPGETIVVRGNVIKPEEFEALQQFGLAQPEDRWQNTAGALILTLLMLILSVIYLRRRPSLTHNMRSMVAISILFLVFLFGARVAFPIHEMVPYLIPLPAFALTISVLFGMEPALIFLLPLVILATYEVPNSFELIMYHGLGSMVGVLVPRREQRITAYLWIGFTVAITGAAVIAAYRLPYPNIDWMELASAATSALLNGMVAGGTTVLMQYFIAPILGLTTPLQLLELSRPDHPVLEYLLRNAPGTYQHSLQVANLAEQAAERIGADSLLTRVGALYHDIGKAANPQFFIENQRAGQIDTHDDLPPETSAALIIRHVTDGLKMATDHNLPRRIQDFIAEHHGTLYTQYQYTQALNNAKESEEEVNETLFQYPGPSPLSRETALVMLADGCEARVRAQRPETNEELKEMVKDTVDQRVADAQLDNTKISLQELKVIVDSYTATLKGIYHPRVDYPELAAGNNKQNSFDQPTLPIIKPVILNEEETAIVQPAATENPPEDAAEEPQPGEELS